MVTEFSDNGECGIRTHVPLRTTAFRVRLVMTTSILLLVDFSPTVPASAFSGLSFSGNFWAELFGRTHIFKIFCFAITVEITGFLSDITTSHRFDFECRTIDHSDNSPCLFAVFCPAMVSIH